MPHSRFSGEEIEQRGEKIYAELLRPHIETEDNIGKIISINIETGDYELSDAGDLLTGAMRLQAKHPHAAIYVNASDLTLSSVLGGLPIG
jgi:hypothetical protein